MWRRLLGKLAWSTALRDAFRHLMVPTAFKLQHKLCLRGKAVCEHRHENTPKLGSMMAATCFQSIQQVNADSPVASGKHKFIQRSHPNHFTRLGSPDMSAETGLLEHPAADLKLV